MKEIIESGARAQAQRTCQRPGVELKFRPAPGFISVLHMPRFIFLLASLLAAAPLFGADDARALWTGGVQALLDQHCVKCHGPLKKKSGLELDTVEAVLKGNEDGAVVVPGKPDESQDDRGVRAGRRSAHAAEEAIDGTRDREGAYVDRSAR